ncbi:DUF3176 domain-containing protein [Aspergillus mulundensis]|uniref:Uncharacterized protein n=1 Tax=Aspergillus mulundensis TaxID=1810919 RepID=A0A3D8QNP9_9EURO|nr:hypothetical protein DSM5745_10195 [Aspergillus mulundensis]RDW63084.1 hypothetical protein DSM5745_10195 [Aspergillus mulundensis]
MSHYMHVDASQDHASEYELLARTASPRPRQPTNPPKRPRRLIRSWSSLTANTWFWEILAILFSLACFTSIICVLIVCNDKPQPRFSYGVTLNAIIAILATASKSSLIYVVSECIGQLKWIWFYGEQKRQLDDIQLFDSAGRGPLGSLLVLFHHRGKSLVSLGALITLLALIFDPSLQQLLTHSSRPAVEKAAYAEATANRALDFLPGTISAERSATELHQIITTGVWSKTPEHLNPVVTCLSRNCIWKAFKTAAICTQCEDITTLTRLKCDPIDINDTLAGGRGYIDETRCNLIPPQGEDYRYAIKIENYYDNRTTIHVPTQSMWSPFTLRPGHAGMHGGSIETYAGMANPQLVLAHAQLTLIKEKVTGLTKQLDLAKVFRVAKATQCALTICTRTYNILVTNGTASFNVSATDYGERFPSPDGNLDYDCWRPVHNSTSELPVMTETVGH